jgi:hypothetical protein
LVNFWELSRKERERTVEMHYLTTSSVAIEHDAAFAGLSGIEAWRSGQTNTGHAVAVRDYLLQKLVPESSLKRFLEQASATDVQEKLIRRFHWITDRPGIDSVKRSVDDRITLLLAAARRPQSLTPQVRMHLESHYWEVILRTPSSERQLTRADLLRQIELACTAYLPIPLDQLELMSRNLPALLGNTRPGLALLHLLREKTPRPPEPLLARPTLTAALGELLARRTAVLITGTVYKGKTTIAQLVIGESPRILRRLRSLRGWSHEQDEEVFT